MRYGLAGVKQRVMDAMAKRAKQQCAGAQDWPPPCQFIMFQPERPRLPETKEEETEK